MKVEWIGSPNFWQGRSAKISKLVQHWMAGTMAAADATFQNRTTQTSAHYGIEGSSVHQYVRDEDTAWHALSANAFAIGIEHSAGPGRAATDATYATSIELNTALCRKYGLDPYQAIVPHSQYVNTQCPGTLDLNRIRKGVDQKLKGEEEMKPATYETARIYIQEMLFRDLPRDEWEKYYKGMTPVQIFDYTRDSKEREDRIAAWRKAADRPLTEAERKLEQVRKIVGA